MVKGSIHADAVCHQLLEALTTFLFYSNNLFINHFIHTVLFDIMDNLGIVFFENWCMHSADLFL